MATSFSVPCPSCESGVPVKGRGMIGKKIDCPKCKYRFTVPDPDAAADDTPAAAEAAPKKKKARGSPMVLVGVLLGVFAVGVLGVGGWLILGGDDSPSKTTTSTPQPRPNPTPTPAVTPNDGGGNTTDPTTDPGVPTGPIGSEIGLPGSVKPVNTKVGAEADKPVAADKLKDPTNLLPGRTAAVLRLNMDRVLQTPLHGAFFDTQTQDFFRSAMAFHLNTVESIVVSVSETDRDPFVVIRTKTPFSSQAVLGGMELQPGPRGAIQGREYFVLKSNPFVNAVSRALSTESLLGEAGLPITEEDKKRWKEKPFALTIYDSQTLLVGDVLVLERFLDDLDKNGDPPFVTELTPAGADAGASTPPGDPGAGDGSDEGGAATPGKPSGRGAAPGAPGPGGFPGAPAAPGAGALGPMGPGGPPGAPGAGQPRRPAKLFTSVPTYRTIKSELKFLLNRLEEDEKNPPALVYAEILDQRLYQRDLSAYEQIGLITQAIVQNVKAVGVALNALNREKFQATLLFQYVSADDAQKSVNESIVPLLNILRLPLGLFLGANVDVRTGGNTQNQSGGGEFGGDPSGPGATDGGVGREGGGPPSPPAPGGPGAPPTPGSPPPGYPGAPGGGRFGGPPGGGTGTGTGSLSFFNVSLSDTLAAIDIELVWNADRFNKHLQTAIQTAGSQLKGRMAVLSGETTWHNLAAGVRKMAENKQGYPRGTMERASRPERYGLPYPPDHRASFLVELLPFIGKAGLRSTIQDKKYAWYAKENLPAATQWVPEFLVPYYPQSSWRATHPLADGRSLGGTNFVGLSGLGLDSARANPADAGMARRVGMTGYDWGSRPSEVTDGLSNTAYMIQVPPGFNRAWIAGGGSTVMGVDDAAANPVADFVHRTPDGKRGTYVLMGDGTVRWVPEGIDPAVFKAIVTRAGGEAIDLDKNAPKEEPKGRQIELKGRGEVVKTTPKAATPPAAADKWSDEAEAEMKKFHGRWAITALVQGKNRLNEEQLKVLKGTSVEIEDRRMTLSMGGKVVSIGEVTKLDPKATPKTMETKQLQGPEVGKTGVGVYEFVGTDVVRIRVAMDGKTAPKSTGPPEDDSTDGYFELKRARD